MTARRDENAPPEEQAATGAYVPSDEPDPRATEAYRTVPPRSDRYAARKFHARGGMGEVWLADDPEIGRQVALKRLRADGAAQRERFVFEARVTGQLEHPGIVPVHDLGADDEGRPFYVMTFVQGRTLQAAIADYYAVESPDEVQWLTLLEAFVRLCQTIAYAHSRGVIHRDLKPDNVMLGPYGETFVLDWGLAKVLGEGDLEEGVSYVPLTSGGGSSSETEGGQVLGAPLYMAPEVAEGRAGEADQRTDVYLLGSTLYEILTGRPPRQGKSKAEIIELARTTPPVPPRSRNPRVPHALEAICQKAMSRSKEGRYAGAQEMAEDVQRFLAGEPVLAYPEGPLARARRWAWKHRKLLTRIAVTAMVLAGAVFAGLRVYQAEQTAAVLRRQEQTRSMVREFRRLADEAMFFAASTDAVAERAPYFAPQKGEEAARAAEAIARPWGPDLKGLDVSGEDLPALRREVYDLLLLLAQLRSQATADARTAAQEGLGLLDRAALVGAPSRGWHRVQAVCLRRLDRPGDALAAEQRAGAPGTPASALDHFLQGEAIRRQGSGSLKQAIEEYQRALRIDPTHYWSRFQLGRCHLALGQDERAVEALSACITARPDAPWAYSARGLARALGRDFPEAERDVQRALELTPDFRPAQLNLGAVYWLEKDRARALEQLDAVLAPPAEKRLVEAAYYRGLLYLEKGEPGKAVEDFTRVVTEQPGFRPAYLARAQAHFVQDRDDAGKGDLDAYLLAGDPRFDPNTPDAAEQRGRLLRRQLATWKLSGPTRKAKLELALAELDRALTAGRRSAALFDDRGAVLDRLGRTEEAIKAYSQGLVLSSDDVKLLLKRGRAYVTLDPPETAKAEEDYGRALRLAPTSAEAYAGRGYALACRDDAVGAQRAVTEAMLHGGGDYLILHNVACVYARLGESDRERQAAYQETAIDLLRRAVELWSRREAGPDERELIRDEPALKPLRGRPEFAELTGRGK